MRIAIVGTSGCGKSTLSWRLAEVTGAICVDLDDLHWLPNWTKRPDDEFCQLIQTRLTAQRWVVSGNYSIVRHLIWPHADLIVWIDLPRSTCLWRALKRSVVRIARGEVCCNGNRESLRRLLSRQSILVWIWTTYQRRKRDYTALWREGRLLRLRSRREIERFIEQIAASQSHPPQSPKCSA